MRDATEESLNRYLLNWNSTMKYDTADKWKKSFILDEDFFYYGQDKHFYHDVEKVVYKSEVLSKAGAEYPEFEFWLVLKSGLELKGEISRASALKGLTFLGWGMKAVHADLQKVYSDICQRTLPFRFKKYEKSFNDTGRWWLGNELKYEVHMSELGSVYRDGEFFCNIFDDENLEIYGNGPWDRRIRKKASGGASLLKKMLPGDDVQEVCILTNFDSDIRNYLLEHKLHMAWDHGSSLTERAKAAVKKLLG